MQTQIGTESGTRIAAARRDGVPRLLAWALIAGAVALGGCDSRTENTPSTQMKNEMKNGTSADGPASTSPPVSASAQSTASSAADRDFLANAASSGMLEVEASRLAAERASAPAVKAFAEHMRKDHETAHEALKKLAAGENVELPTALSTRHQSQLDRLASLKGAQFDREYTQAIGVAAHQEAVALFERAAGAADDPEVKAFAGKMLPTLREHLKQAQTLQQAVAGKDAVRKQ